MIDENDKAIVEKDLVFEAAILDYTESFLADGGEQSEVTALEARLRWSGFRALAWFASGFGVGFRFADKADVDGKGDSPHAKLVDRTLYVTPSPDASMLQSASYELAGLSGDARPGAQRDMLFRLMAWGSSFGLTDEDRARIMAISAANVFDALDADYLASSHRVAV